MDASGEDSGFADASEFTLYKLDNQSKWWKESCTHFHVVCSDKQRHWEAKIICIAGQTSLLSMVSIVCVMRVCTLLACHGQ
jgi:hypothetical protein